MSRGRSHQRVYQGKRGNCPRISTKTWAKCITLSTLAKLFEAWRLRTLNLHANSCSRACAREPNPNSPWRGGAVDRTGLRKPHPRSYGTAGLHKATQRAASSEIFPVLDMYYLCCPTGGGRRVVNGQVESPQRECAGTPFETANPHN